MPRIIREGNVDYLVYSPEERRRAVRRATIAVWLFAIWVPLAWLLHSLFSLSAIPLGVIGVILFGAAAQSFFMAVEGQARLDGD